jgi:hypothetical protein
MASIRGLEKYIEPLTGLLQVASSGFPSHGDLRSVFSHLQTKYGVLDATKVVAIRACNEVCEAWRSMAKLVYCLKKEKRQVSDAIQALVDLIVLPAPDDEGDAKPAASAASSTEKSLELEDVKGMFAHPSEDEPLTESDEDDDNKIELVSSICKCNVCRLNLQHTGPINIDDEDDDDDRPLVPSKAVSEAPKSISASQAPKSIEVPDPRPGHQRKQTMMDDARHRYSAKSIPRKGDECKEDLEKAGKKVKGKKVKGIKVKGKMTKKDLAMVIKMPIKIVHRRVQSGSSKQGAYILGNGIYVVGLTVGRSKSYLEKVHACAEAIRNGSVKTVAAARSWLLHLQ